MIIEKSERIHKILCWFVQKKVEYNIIDGGGGGVCVW